MNESRAVSSFCKESQDRCPGSWWWGETISSLPTKTMGMDPQSWVLEMSGLFAAQSTWHKIWPEILVPGRRRTALLVAWTEAESRGSTRAESWAPSPGDCQLKLSWLSSCSAGGIRAWSLGWNSGHEVPFGSHNKLCMKCQSTDRAQVNAWRSHSSRWHAAGSCGLSTSPTLTFHTDLCSFFFPTTYTFDLCSRTVQGKVLSQTTSRSRLTLSVWNILRAIGCTEEGMAGIWVYRLSLNQTPPHILLRLSGKVI